ncbi:MAG: mechanosensitive ion channel family protein [Gammaproteobacteria bacterium]|nr:mechanosensitive ion channel family protein [Gammaproteobacteria bacterium]
MRITKLISSGAHLGLALLCLALINPITASAQMATSTTEQPAPIELPDKLTREEVRDLIARLSDDQVRELIIRQLDKNALAADQQTDASIVYFEQLKTGITSAWSTLGRMFDTKQQLYALPSMIWQGISDDGEISAAFLLFQLIGLLVVGFAVEYLAKRLLEKVKSRTTNVLPFGKRFDLACYGTALGLLELGAFAVGAILFVEITGTHTEAAQTLWYQVIWCLLLIKLVLLAVRQIAAPASTETRLVSITDSVARQIWAWSLMLTSSLILPLPVITVTKDFGASAETALLIRVLFGVIFIALLIVLIVRLRHYGARLVAGNGADNGVILQGLARIWWILSIVYVLLIWFMSIGKRAATGESSLVPGMGSLLLFVLIPYFDMGLKWLITRFFEDKPEEIEPGEITSAEETDTAITAATAAFEPEAGTDVEPEATAATEPEVGADVNNFRQDVAPAYIAVALRYARVLMVIAILAIFMRLWDIDLRAISAQLLGQRFAGALFDIGITALLTWALWGVIRISIERKLDDGKGSAENAEGESDAGGLGGTRVETVLPLIRIFIKITLIVMAIMISLSSLGVDIGPLIAGAGVIGIAIGFGAQTLVRDIVSGFFYLVDDAFRIGEYVVIDQIRGTVEKISVRSFQLRHHNGPVHTIPYGEIRTLTNWSRDWAIMKFELRIPFETDIDMVRKTIKQIGIEMMEDPVFGPLMLQPVKSQGVNRMDDSALIIRCKFTAIPGQQYLIRREAFTRIQKVFEEKGIQFAPRRVLVEATTPQEAVRGAAAVLDQEVEGESAPKDNQSDQ